jgi:YfiH family protein
VLYSSLLSGLGWVDHGFGSRLDVVSQESTASLKQIHSALVLITSQAGCIGEADALVTDRPGIPVSVRTADCYPILLADIRNHTVAAIHAGWRGTASQIIAATLGKMREEFGTLPASVYAAIGPGIGACCYEVGPEVARLFGLERAGKIDLAEANRLQLLAAGVPQAHIQVAGKCTMCDAAQFHSYRREKERAGRMVSFIGIR